jgi:hypothetical protein
MLRLGPVIRACGQRFCGDRPALAFAGEDGPQRRGDPQDLFLSHAGGLEFLGLVHDHDVGQIANHRKRVERHLLRGGPAGHVGLFNGLPRPGQGGIVERQSMDQHAAPDGQFREQPRVLLAAAPENQAEAFALLQRGSGV